MWPVPPQMCTDSCGYSERGGHGVTLRVPRRISCSEFCWQEEGGSQSCEAGKLLQRYETARHSPSSECTTQILSLQCLQEIVDSWILNCTSIRPASDPGEKTYTSSYMFSQFGPPPLSRALHWSCLLFASVLQQTIKSRGQKSKSKSIFMFKFKSADY